MGPLKAMAAACLPRPYVDQNALKALTRLPWLLWAPLPPQTSSPQTSSKSFPPKLPPNPPKILERFPRIIMKMILKTFYKNLPNPWLPLASLASSQGLGSPPPLTCRASAGEPAYTSQAEPAFALLTITLDRPQHKVL